MGTSPAVISSFVTDGGEWQEKTIVLELEHVAQLLKMSNKELEENGVIFEAGNCTLNDGTQIPATWKYSFEHTIKYGQKWFGGFLVLHPPTNISDVKSAKASYSVSWSYGGFLSSSFTANDQKEFAATSTGGRDTLIKESDLRPKTFLKDTLVVTLVMKVFSSHSFNPVFNISPSISTVQLMGQMTSDLAKMLESGDWSDVKIKVPNEIGGAVDASSYTRKAHKAILTARSSVFAKMFAKETARIEAQTGKMVVKDLSPKGLDIFLHYLYTGEVLQDWVQVGTEILKAAETYDCVELKEYCRLNILDALSTSNAVELYKLTKLHGLVDDAKKVVDFISKNTEAVIDQVVQEGK